MGAFTIVLITLLSLALFGYTGLFIWVGFIRHRVRSPGRSYCCSRCYPDRPGQFECVQPKLPDGSVDKANEMVCNATSGVCEPRAHPGVCSSPTWNDSCPAGTLGF